MKNKATKVISMLLCLVMLFSALPISAMAAFDYAHNEAESSDDYYNIVSKKDWDIAPGITETEIVLNNDAGDRRQVVHLMEADISNEYTRVISSYTKMDTSNYAISTIPEHAAYIEEEWGENVVGAMNTCLSWYNSAAYAEDPSRVNEPLGFMMVDGNVYFDHSVGFPTCIVIHKDTNANGESRPTDIPKVEMRTVTDSSCLNGWEDQVIPCSSGYIVKDGVNQQKAAHDSSTAARSVVGVKADGSVVIMMNDGRQAPFSLGMNMYECAEVMIAAGCVYAANCDGGGSSTFMSQRPGEDLEVNCSPCDGSLRQNTHGIIFISTAPATGEFYNAYLVTESDYYVPFSEVEITAIGRDFSGAEADIPSEAVWSLTDTSFGSIENGVFTSNGKTGDVTVVLSYNGETVGSKTIHIVNPEVVAFAQSSTIIPYGKTVALDITATYGEFDVTYTADDFTWSLSDEEAGTRDGMQFTATTDSTKTGVTVTATYKHADLGSTSQDISFGLGSQVLYDFEDGDISDWLGRDALRVWAEKNNPDSPIFDAAPFGNNFSKGNDSATFLATAENGKVKNGNYALGVELDYTHSGSFGQWTYNMFFNVDGQIVLRDVANGQNATRLGMWIYIPEELAPGHNLAMQAELYAGSSSASYARKNTHLILECNGKTLTKCTEADIPEDRWVYCYMDLASYNYVAIQNPYQSTSDRREPQFIRFYTQSKEPFNAVLYIDDITLDYSAAVDDRNAPAISDILISTSGTTIRSFTATVKDYVASNASGLDYSSAKIYVDGVALNGVSASGTTISSTDVTLTPGAHTVLFEISDKLGNTAKESQSFTVQGTAPVALAGHNDLNYVPEYDSVYYVDITAENIENITSVSTDVYLNFANTWELDHMIVAAGFEAEYTLDENHNVATVTVTRTGDSASGEAVLVSVPVRVWSWDAEGAGFEKEAIEGNSYPDVLIKTDVRRGSVEFKDGTTGTFDGGFSIATAVTSTVVPSKWHVHTETALDDKAGNCTENGYTDRTYCNDCGSVLAWGTVNKAQGHNYSVVEGVLKCTCDALFTGTYEGKEYVGGVIVSDGWVKDTYYYKDGVKLTSSHLLDDKDGGEQKKLYTFDEDGTYLPDYRFDGFYEIDDTVMYFVANEYLTGVQRISGSSYNFDKNGMGYDGFVSIDGANCLFENGLSVANENVLYAGICGKDAHFVLYTDGTMSITGSGPMYDHQSIGNNPWYDYSYRKTIHTVKIGKDITTIGVRAFQNSPKLDTIVFEDGSKLEKISVHAFTDCPKLTVITLPEGLKVIEDSAFLRSAGITDMYMPESLEKIGGYTFGDTLPANLKMSVAANSVAHTFAKYHKISFEIRPMADLTGTCGKNATWALSADGKLTISGSGALHDYSYLKLGDDAAPWTTYRDAITTLEIGKDITALGTYNFYNCTELAEVTFEEGSKLEHIGKGAFGYTGISTLTLPAALKTIDATAFYFSALERVAFEEGSQLQAIGNYAFRDCTSLKTVYIPDGVDAIGSAPFYNVPAANLTLSVAEDTYGHKYAASTSFTIDLREAAPISIYSGSCGTNAEWTLYSNGKLVISGSGAMNDYSYLKYGDDAAPWTLHRGKITAVEIGKDITAVGTYSFYNCTALSSVVFEQGCQVETIGTGAFGYTAIPSITLPAALKTLDATAFYFSALERVSFEEKSKLKTIGNYAFRDCKSLMNVYIPDGVDTFGSAPFHNVPTATLTLDVAKDTYGHKYAISKNHTVTVREPVPVSIYSGTCGATAKWDLYSDGKLVISGSGAMANYSYLKYGDEAAPWTLYRGKITSLEIGKDITAIGTYNFYNCTVLSSVVFEAGSKLERIGVGAFGYTTALKSITLPASLKIIDNTGFYFSGLETVDFEENSVLVTVGNYAFRNCTSLTSIYIPDYVDTIGTAIFHACEDTVTANVVNGSYAHKYMISKGYRVVTR